MRCGFPLVALPQIRLAAPAALKKRLSAKGEKNSSRHSAGFFEKWKVLQSF
jgi:hypothetical protein